MMKRLLPMSVALSLLAVAFAACEKSNAVVEQEQVQQALHACDKGCEQPPPGCDIKGNISTTGTKYYHVFGTKNYAAIRIQPEKGERWFCTEQEALANGYTRKDN